MKKLQSMRAAPGEYSPCNVLISCFQREKTEQHRPPGFGPAGSAVPGSSQSTSGLDAEQRLWQIMARYDLKLNL